MSNPKEIFRNRGILDAALELWWKPTANGFSFPAFLPDGKSTYWRGSYNTDPLTRDRFGKVNLKGKPTNLLYYIPSDVRDAIADDGGLVYLASGLTDLLSYRAAGLRNVVTWFSGELSIPLSLDRDLHDLGAQTVFFVPDCDVVGSRAATKVAGILAGSDLNLDIRQLPSGDINDLWVRLDGLPASVFKLAIHALPSADIQADETVIPRPYIPPDDRVPIPSLDTRQAIYQALEAEKWRSTSKGRKAPVRCPFHDDQHPSAVIFENLDCSLVLHCKVCGQYILKQLCDKLNIDCKFEQSTYSPSQPNKLKNHKSQRETTSLSWASPEPPQSPSEHRQAELPKPPLGQSTEALQASQSHLSEAPLEQASEPLQADLTALSSEQPPQPLQALSDDLRISMIGRGHIWQARLFDCLLRVTPQMMGQSVTYKTITSAVSQYGWSYSSVQKTLKSFKLLGRSLAKMCMFFSVAEGDQANSAKLPTSTKVIDLPTLEELQDEYCDLSCEAPCPLPAAALLSNKRYRMESHLRNIQLNQDRWVATENYPATAQLGQLICVSQRTVWKYEGELPIHKKRRYEEKVISGVCGLTEEQKRRGCYIKETAGQYILRTPLPSARSVSR